MSKNTSTDRGNIDKNENKNPSDQRQPESVTPPPLPKEIGGRAGPEPTRFGDWEYKGRCIDF